MTVYKSKKENQKESFFPPYYIYRQKEGLIIFYLQAILIELEIVACIVVADILNHTRETLHIVRQQTLLHIIAEQVAKQTTEVLMTWVAEE